MGAQSSTNRSDTRTFNVLLIGAEQSDQVSLSRLMGITRYRTRRYQLTSLGTDGRLSEAGELIARSDIVMVNVNNPRAILFWSRAAARVPGAKQHPAIRITRDHNPKSDPDLTISWPINPTRVIRTLDRYTVNHLDYIPEFEIGGEEHPSAAVTPLPVKNDRSAQTAEVATPSQPTARALVADDSLAVRRQLAMEFERMDCDLKSVADGASALLAAEQEQFDIIFLDVIMPEIDGYSVCKRIRRTPKNRQTPIVLLTSKSSQFDRLKGKLSGCDTYLTKPINHNEFCSVAEQHIDLPAVRKKGAK